MFFSTPSSCSIWKLFEVLFRGLKRKKKKKKRKKKIKLNCEAQESQNQNPFSSLILVIRNNATNQLVLHFQTFLILGWIFNLSLVNNFNSLVTVKSNVNMSFRSTDWKCHNSSNTINRKKRYPSSFGCSTKNSTRVSKCRNCFQSKCKSSCSDSPDYIIWCITVNFWDQFSVLACDKAILNLSFSNFKHSL